MIQPDRTWLITGCSTGFGRELALQALARGEQVVVTARRPQSVADIVATAPERAVSVQLDVTDPQQVKAAVEAADARFGRLDVLVNNAGRVLVGGVEEGSEPEIRDVFETNFFGAVAMTQAALPLMRRQRRGHIINISSMGGISGGLGMAYYAATKFALAGLSESLALETAPLGIKVTVVEPGAHRTPAIEHAIYAAKMLSDYPKLAEHREIMREHGRTQTGDPALAAGAIIAVADAKDPPLHLPLGADAFDRLNRKIDRLVADRDAWRDLILSTARREPA